jgi:hypothetical protein
VANAQDRRVHPHEEPGVLELSSLREADDVPRILGGALHEGGCRRLRGVHLAGARHLRVLRDGYQRGEMMTEIQGFHYDPIDYKEKYEKAKAELARLQPLKRFQHGVMTCPNCHAILRLEQGEIVEWTALEE